MNACGGSLWSSVVDTGGFMLWILAVDPGGAEGTCSLSSSIKGCLPLKVDFHQLSSSIKGSLKSKVSSHQKLSSIKGRLPSKVIFHLRSSSVKSSPWAKLQTCILLLSVRFWWGFLSMTCQFPILGRSLEFYNIIDITLTFFHFWGLDDCSW